MNNKRNYQFFLFFFILIIFSGTYYLYFYNKVEKNKSIKIEEKNDLSIDLNKNTIENLSFESIDKNGNTYLINALDGNPDIDKPEIINLSYVKALIQLRNGEEITIESNLAKYNKLNNETKFSGNIKAIYINHILTSENLDLLFQEHLIAAYNQLVYKNFNNTLIGDRLEINIVTKNLKIFMNNELENVIILRN